MHRVFILTLSIICLFAISAHSEVRLIGFPDGPGGVGADGPPPEVLGDHSMTPFPAFDGGPLGGRTDAIASPVGGEIRFNSSLLRISTMSVVWPHGYQGNLYTDTEFPGLIDITLPPETRAFYVYGISSTGGIDVIRATSQTGETLAELTTAFGGAQGYGFYVTEPGEVLTTVRLSTDGGLLTIGEFGIAIPEPTTAALLLAGAALVRRRVLSS